MIGRAAGSPGNRQRIRFGLALTRAFLLFALLCWLGMQAGLQVRSLRQKGYALNRTATTSLALPFVGVTVELAQSEAPEQRAALDRVHANGVGWVRQRFDWATLEPAPGLFDWRTSDAMLAAIDNAGLTPVVLLDGSPAWARAEKDRTPTDNPDAPPADPKTFARFAAAFAHRYGEQVDYYQIWDEPNIAPHWGNRHVEPVHYAHLLMEAGKAIRAVDANAAIIAAALAPTTDQGHTAIDEVTFLRRLYAAGIQSQVDAVAAHPYGFGRSAADPSQRRAILNFQRAAWLRRAMVDAGDGATPLLVTGYGWNRHPASPWRTVDATDQRAFLADALAIGWQQWPWLAGLGWAIDQPAAPLDDPRWGFALDDELLNTIGTWSLGHPVDRPGPVATPPWGLFFSLTAVATVLWRGWAALDLLPWAAWQQTQQHWPIWLQIGIWAGLITLYHLAVWPPLIALSLVLAAALIAMQPHVGLWLAAAVLPFTFQHKAFALVDQTLFFAPAQAAILATLPALAIRAWHARPRHRPAISAPSKKYPASAGDAKAIRSLDCFALLWLLLGLLASLNVWFWPGYVTGLIDLVLTPLLLYAMLRLTATQRQHLVGTALALFAGGVAVAVIGLAHWLLGGGTDADALRRLVGPYFSPNHAALYLERTFFLGLGVWLAWARVRNLSEPFTRHQRWRGPILIGAVGTVAVALLLTASRGALLLGLPAGLITFAWLVGSGAGQRQPRPCWRIGIALLAILLLGALALSVAFWPRISNTATLLERLAVWQASLRLWQAFPLLGAGPGGFFWRYPAFIPPGSPLDPNLRHPHNVWLEMGTSWGALGIVWLFSLLVWSAKRVWVERRTLHAVAGSGIAIGLLAGLAAGLVHGQVDAYAALADIAAWNWLALGLWRALAVHGESNPTATTHKE